MPIQIGLHMELR